MICNLCRKIPTIGDVISLIIADKTTKLQQPHQTVFLFEIMQPAAFLWVICAICGRIYIQTYSINIHKRTPKISRRPRRSTQTKPTTTKQP